MPLDDDAEGQYLKLLAGAVLLMALAIGLYRVYARRPNAPLHPQVKRLFVDRDRLPRTMERRGFDRGTKQDVRSAFADQQLSAFRQHDPGSAATSNDVLQVLENDILYGRDFHIRHLLADDFLRRSVVAAMRMGDNDLMHTIREVFVAFGSHHLIGAWDDICHNLTHGTGKDWYQKAGGALVNELGKALANVRGQLFLSERMSNLAAGTLPDVTPDALALLGEPNVRSILTHGVRLMKKLGLEPRLQMVEGELMLGFTGSRGALFGFGFRSGADRDRQVNPLSLLSGEEYRLVWNNTPPKTKLVYAYNVRPVETVGAVLLVFVIAASAGLRHFGSPAT